MFRDRLPVVAGVALVAGVCLCAMWAFRLPPAERGDALALLALVVGLERVPWIMGLGPVARS